MAVGGMLAKYRLDFLFQRPVFVRLLRSIIQRCSRQPDGFRKRATNCRMIADHFFFWAVESLSVSSPTSSKSSLFSRFSFANSSTDGTLSAPLPSQPYTVVSLTPASFAACATESPSFLMRFKSSCRTSAATLYLFFICLQSMHYLSSVDCRPSVLNLGYRSLSSTSETSKCSSVSSHRFRGRWVAISGITSPLSLR